MGNNYFANGGIDIFDHDTTVKGDEATVYIKHEEPKNAYLWMLFLLNEIWQEVTYPS